MNRYTHKATGAVALMVRLDAELADNTADREAHPGDPTIEMMVRYGMLPPAALDWIKRDAHRP